MRRMTDAELIDAYRIAIEHELDRDFVQMLEEEIDRRRINIQSVLQKQDE